MIKVEHPIKRLLDEIDINCAELARITGINHESLSRYINYRKKPDSRNCYKIIDFAARHGIKITLEELMPRE